MPRVFPTEITAENVATLLAGLRGSTPQIAETAHLDFHTPNGYTVEVTLLDGWQHPQGRRVIEEAVTLLPRFQAQVVEMLARHGRNDGSDDHELGYVEINEEQVYLFYCAQNYNSTWDMAYSRDCSGQWQLDGPPPPSVGEFSPAWRSETVVALAKVIHADRAFDRMPILADALEETGCDNADVLAHCRGADPHARGCWVIALLLDKE
jgi:hypothetical protein